MHQQTFEIREQAIQAVRAGVADLNNHIQKQFGISRQAVNQHLKNLEGEGLLTSAGNTKSKIYQLGNIRSQSKLINLNQKIDEFDVYQQDFEWVVEDVPENIQEIIDWGFTEILNNAIDHSQANEITVNLELENDKINLMILDNGEGIFNRIKRIKGFNNDQRVVLELSKGKLTTDDKNHTGLGIFFSIKAFDVFGIYSNNHLYDFIDDVEISLADVGMMEAVQTFNQTDLSTAILMSISLSSKTILKDVFDAFAKAPEFEFDTTIVPMYLAHEKQKLVSRSQAKQVANRLDEFKFVTFDFKGIESIGQGFADELFRVYPNKNPQINFDTINVTMEVEKMIKRVKNE